MQISVSMLSSPYTGPKSAALNSERNLETNFLSLLEFISVVDNAKHMDKIDIETLLVQNSLSCYSILSLSQLDIYG